MFKVGKEINMTGLKEKQKINIPFPNYNLLFSKQFKSYVKR